MIILLIDCKLIFIGSDATYAYRSKVTSIQFGYDSDIISSTFTMVDASSAYHITAQLSTQFLTQIGVTFTALALPYSTLSSPPVSLTKSWSLVTSLNKILYKKF